ncbi:MAG: tRNA pseudouridine(55) synthase TruB, partial [Myxococcota bacterium]
VRAICRDVGAALGVGGHCTALRRLSSSGFDIDQAVPLDAVLDAWTADDVAHHMRPPLEMVHPLARMDADASTARALAYGQRPVYTGDLEEGRPMAVAYQDQLIAVAEVTAERTLKVIRAMPREAIPTELGI